MRKIYNISILLSVLFIGFVACNKDKESTMAPNTENEVFLSEEDLAAENAIKYFKNKINESTFKDGEGIELDSAIWYMEAYTNYSYCFADTSVSDIVVDTLLFDLMTMNSELNFSTMQQIVNSVGENLLSNYVNMNSNNAVIVLSDFSLLEDEFKSDSKTVQVVTIYGLESPSVASGSDCYGGYTFDSPMHFADAVEVFEDYINNPQCPQVGYHYVTNIEWRYVDANHTNDDYLNPNDITPQDNYYDYLYFYQFEWWSNDHEIMSAAELNFYFEQIYQELIPRKLEAIEEAQPTNRTFIRCLFDYHQSTAPINQTEWHHAYSFQFGNKRIRMDDTNNPIDL